MSSPDEEDRIVKCDGCSKKYDMDKEHDISCYICEDYFCEACQKNPQIIRNYQSDDDFDELDIDDYLCGKCSSETEKSCFEIEKKVDEKDLPKLPEHILAMVAKLKPYADYRQKRKHAQKKHVLAVLRKRKAK